MDQIWTLVLNTKKKETVPRIIKKFVDKLDKHNFEILRSEQMSDQNFKVYARTPLKSSNWSEAVIEAVSLGQKFSYGWSLMGDISSYVEAYASKNFRMSGILWVDWCLYK